jgi:glycosyltransferase involved in cell wall biosynthesis
VRVLHAAADIAAQASVLTAALRGEDVSAESWAYNVEYTRFPTDRPLPYDNAPIPRRLFGYLKTTLEALGRFDLLHFHFGRGLFPPRNFDLPLHRLLGTPMVFHFHGCDVRDRAMMNRRHERAACTECDPFCSPSRQRQVIAEARKYGSAIFVSTPDLLESVPDAEHLPVALDLERWAPEPMQGPPAEGSKMTVLHAPTNRLIKGTAHVMSAVGEASSENPGIRFELAEHLAWDVLRERMRAADVVVDQMFLGWYGLVAVEAMALGKPVVGYIRPDFESLTGDLPLVRIDSNEALTRELLALAADPARRTELGRAGRAYVERVHAAPMIARRLVECYRQVLGEDKALR